jgi:hypothetical protein
LVRWYFIGVIQLNFLTCWIGQYSHRCDWILSLCYDGLFLHNPVTRFFHHVSITSLSSHPIPSHTFLTIILYGKPFSIFVNKLYKESSGIHLQEAFHFLQPTVLFIVKVGIGLFGCKEKYFFL